MKVYITKYALTAGIVEMQGTQSDKYPTLFRGPKWDDVFHLPYWYTDRKAAETHAEELRIKKIKSLQKQIAKLDNLRF